MKEHFLVCTFLLFVFWSCDTPSTSFKEELTLFNKNTIQEEAKISAYQLQWVKPGGKGSINSENPYICYIWRGGENGYKGVEAHVWQVIFPNKITENAGSKTTRFVYKQNKFNGNLIRYAGCTVPDSEDAINLIKKAFDGNRSGSQHSNRQSNDSTLTIMSDCGDYECELEWDHSRQEYVCTAPPCDGGEDEENGDGPPYGDGGGGTPPGDGGGGDNDEELPEFLEPCDTGNAHLDDVPFQDAMYQAWFDSYGPDDEPYAHDQRNETMVIVTATSSGYAFEEIPPGPETSSCHFSAPGTSIPSNIVALIHTHPYGHNDTIEDSKCPAGAYNGNSVSSSDAALVQTIHDEPSLPSIPMYVIDKDKIRIIQPSNPNQYSQTFNRCGY
ncbi:hypothetical protein [Rhodohalobacter halophilus]|uniref:hypothetical protein n=1 Tax=Rhodohalobacter halophilus TaxID=1812810 RepID=UPI00083FAA35|nr:hypothetical protein [Rhodohalobacter halophilus]